MQSLPSLLDDAPEESRVCVLQGRDTLMLPHDRQRLVHSFLGQNFCQRAFAALTGVNPDRTAKIMKEGKVEVPKDTRPTRRSPMRRRWVLAIEAASLHGVPEKYVRQSDYSWRDLGNAMHIASVGSVLSVVFSCTVRV